MPYFDKTPDWVDAISVGAMSPEEGMQAVQVAASRAGMELTSVEAGDLAARLGYDPILVGLFSRLLPDRTLDEISTLAENVFDEFMKKGVYEAIALTKDTYLDVEYHDTLSEVCLHMLKKRNLYPSLREIRGWLRQEPDKLNQLRILIAHGTICRLGENSELIFRHDRIRDILLVKALSSMLAMEVPDADILAEPFYAEIIGRALAETDCDQLVLEQTRDRLPLALFIAIKHFGTPKSDYHNEIIRQARQWVEEIVSNNLAARSVLENVCWVLIETDSPVVLELTEGFPRNPLVDATRLRNGCATSGILFFHDYWFPTSDNLRDRIIEQGKRRQKDQLLNQLKRLLTDGNTESIPALTLAGFLGFTELKDEIVDCWMRVTENRADALPYAIWAATQCCGDESGKLLDPKEKIKIDLNDPIRPGDTIVVPESWF